MKKIDRKFYEKTLRPDRQLSYKLLAEIICSIIDPNSVVDYGCGAGWVLLYLQKSGIEIDDLVGAEPSADIKEVADPNILPAIRTLDLTTPIRLGRTFDLAISLEVVEHIDKEFAEIAVENICRHADNVFFSAATPGQGGYGHVNEQPFEYWEEIFSKLGFRVNSDASDRCRKFLKKHKAKNWYWRNIRILER